MKIFGLILIPLIIVGIILLGLYLFFFQNSFFVSCGDGTLLGFCSEMKPYFCNQLAVLVEKAEECGCDGDFNLSGEFCSSNLFEDNSRKEFVYYFEGKQKSIYLDLYGNLNEHLKSLPRDLVYLENNASRKDFESQKLEDIYQREAMKNLIVKIRNLEHNEESQVQIAISLVQNIPYLEPEEVKVLGGRFSLPLSRYPYQVLYEYAGFCECKSGLLVYLLREMNYGVALFYFPEENHEAVGIKCPMEYSYDETGYCFVETTSPSMISYSEGYYSGYIQLSDNYTLIEMGGNKSLSYELKDYEDAIQFTQLNNKYIEEGDLNIVERDIYFNLEKYYGMI